MCTQCSISHALTCIQCSISHDDITLTCVLNAVSPMMIRMYSMQYHGNCSKWIHNAWHSRARALIIFQGGALRGNVGHLGVDSLTNLQRQPCPRNHPYILMTVYTYVRTSIRNCMFLGRTGYRLWRGSPEYSIWPAIRQ